MHKHPPSGLRCDKGANTLMYSKNTILLVDDEEVVKQRLRDVIKDEYEVLDASNGQEALELLGEHIEQVAVIVLD